MRRRPSWGGSLDGGGDPEHGYSLRGGRMLTTDNYECTWDLFKSIPSLHNAGQTVFDETVAFNEQHRAHSMARLVDKRRAIVPVTSMGFSMQDRIELLKLSKADEGDMGASRITDWLSPSFFETEFWYMWVTTFAFQPWHSAVEFKRYLHRFMLEFSRIETLAGVKRTVYNQYDSLVLPLQAWLGAQGVHFLAACRVTDVDNKTEGGRFTATGLRLMRQDKPEVIAVNDGDLVFFQNGSMTDASSLGSMDNPPAKLTNIDSDGWSLWEKLAEEPQPSKENQMSCCSDVMDPIDALTAGSSSSPAPTAASVKPSCAALPGATQTSSASIAKHRLHPHRTACMSPLKSPQTRASGLRTIREHHGAQVASVIHLAAYYDFFGKPSSKYDEITVQGTARISGWFGHGDGTVPTHALGALRQHDRRHLARQQRLRPFLRQPVPPGERRGERARRHGARRPFAVMATVL